MPGTKRKRVEDESGMLSGYFESIADATARKRYKEKLDIYLGGVDPYEIPVRNWEDNVDLWPSVSYIHVGMYLLCSSSPYTQDQLMDYKNLDCYQKFVSGWVREVLVRKVPGGKVLLIAKVNHSQKLSEKPLVPWVVCGESGRVHTAHCNCMAGLGESCSHVASLLWAAEAGVKKRDSLTVTDKKAYWVMPSAVSKVQPKPLRYIQFTPATSKPKAKHHMPVDGPSQGELDSLFKALSQSGSKPAVLSLIEPYAEAYVPESLHSDLPQLVGVVFDKANMELSYDQLVDLGLEQMKIYDTTEKERKTVEEKTRKQAKSSVWFSMRTGRVTASQFKAVCTTKTRTPAMSLLMRICYPELSKFKSQPTQWGCKHEQKGLSAYNALQEGKHRDWELQACGLFIDKEHGFLAATPDSLVTCSCCGNGVVEVKCSYCHKDDTGPLPLMENNMFEREVDSEGNVRTQLKRNHAYFYQVQAQLQCSGTAYCDLVVWTQHPCTWNGL
ncbi:uncharacterized protein LOC122384449 [Amphibalanus amphitrite]|uniref:uncharacterized protein LOC122384449 n=1 Tax=Amphibalanus amphitrite TaxID=1232801 RepID=UPI001C9183FF|nr:uncharacterized protein LOC122384449 [Amphibalanus amphitrite]